MESRADHRPQREPVGEQTHQRNRSPDVDEQQASGCGHPACTCEPGELNPDCDPQYGYDPIEPWMDHV